MEWDWNEVDGVTTLSAPAGAIQGPLEACLIFGVGRSDETMLLAGISHVVEHLALRPIGHRPYSVNGSVDPVCTRFMVSGGPDDVVEVLGEVARYLHDLPVDELEHELQILQVEERQRASSHLGFHLSHRFGPRGVGLIGWPEHGLRRVGPDEVRDWAHTWFTSGNAALWTSAPVPEHLDLSALPRGSAPPHAPPPRSMPPARTFLQERTNLVSVTAVMEQQLAIAPFLYIAQRRAYDRLRRRDAITYGVAAERVRLDTGHSLVYLGADGSEDTYSRVFEGLVDVWDEFAGSGPTEAEWEDMQRSYEAQVDHPQSRVASLDADAERQVLGLPYVPNDEYWAKVVALTPEQVRAEVEALAPTLSAVVPTEVEDGTAGWTRWEPWSEQTVDGDVHQPIGGREEGELVLGSDGVSWIAEDDRVHTVRWEDAVCAFTWDDGRRTVLAPNGEYVSLVPWCWRGGQHFTQRVDQSIDASRRIRLGEGETQYLLDPNDPESTTDVRWLGSIVGARHDSRRVDLVIDTDGFFVLSSRQTVAGVDARLGHLGRSDRETLLAEDPGNRWISQAEIRLAELRKRTWAKAWGVHSRLSVELHDGSTMTIDLMSDDAVQIAGGGFRQMLGPYFQA